MRRKMSKISAVLRRRHIRIAPILLLLAFALAPVRANASTLHARDLAPIGGIVRTEIQAGRIAGAVILIGGKDKVLYRHAFGYRMLKPKRRMTASTLFDVASLTKVIATTPAVMQLVEQGKLRLDDPVARYWPEFGTDERGAITLRDLLTHYSGLPADLDLDRDWSGYDTAIAMIDALKPIAPPGTKYLYSDVNFEILGELVRRVSGKSLDKYARVHLFAPLGMKNTRFLPPPLWRARIAPTQDLPGRVHWADVHDATARRMGGVAGHAGVFSTADDLAIILRMFLHGGRTKRTRVLSAQSVAEMTTRQSPVDGPRLRGYGWDIGDGEGLSIFPPGTYGHLGFTGTMIWVDPGAEIYTVVLTNRVYPDGAGDAGPLRKAILSLLNDSLHPAGQSGEIGTAPR